MYKMLGGGGPTPSTPTPVLVSCKEAVREGRGILAFKVFSFWSLVLARKFDTSSCTVSPACPKWAPMKILNVPNQVIFIVL